MRTNLRKKKKKNIPPEVSVLVLVNGGTLS